MGENSEDQVPNTIPQHVVQSNADLATLSAEAAEIFTQVPQNIQPSVHTSDAISLLQQENIVQSGQPTGDTNKSDDALSLFNQFFLNPSSTDTQVMTLDNGSYTPDNACQGCPIPAICQVNNEGCALDQSRAPMDSVENMLIMVKQEGDNKQAQMQTNFMQ